MILGIRKLLTRRKIAFGLFHLKDSNELSRQENAANLKVVLQRIWKDLEIETIKLTSVTELSRYHRIIEVRFSKSGYYYEGVSGWKLGELSIWIGHILAWKKFLKSDFSILLLFEDDIKFEANFVDLIHGYLLTAPKDWDVISLFTPETETHMFTSSDNNQQSLVPCFQDSSTLAYAVSKKGAQKLLQGIIEEGEIVLPIDWYLWRNIPKLKILGLHPNLPKPFSLHFWESTFQQKQDRLPLD